MEQGNGLKQEKKLKLPPFIRISCLAILSKTTKGNFNFVVDFLHIFFTMFVCEYNKFLIFNQVHSYAVRVANQQWPLCCTPKKCKRSVAKRLSHTELFQLYCTTDIIVPRITSPTKPMFLDRKVKTLQRCNLNTFLNVISSIFHPPWKKT